MKPIHLLSFATIALTAISAAQADDAMWYSGDADVSVSEVDTYFADAVPGTGRGLQLPDPTTQDWTERGKTSGTDLIGSVDTKAPEYFDGYTPNVFKNADAKLGIPRQFFKIDEYASIAPIYDETARHGAVEGGNLFAKADIDWRAIF